MGKRYIRLLGWRAQQRPAPGGKYQESLYITISENRSIRGDNMISEIAANTFILGKPLFIYVGIIGFLLLLATASIPLMNQKREKKIPMKYHFWLARTTIFVAIVHGFLAASLYIGF
jgi:hypothetical protein